MCRDICCNICGRVYAFCHRADCRSEENWKHLCNHPQRTDRLEWDPVRTAPDALVGEVLTEAGAGGANGNQRHFDPEPMIQFALEEGLADASAEEILRKSLIGYI